MNNLNADKVVVVTGDVAMDWNLARTHRCESVVSFWNEVDATSTYWQRGGSALLADVLEALAEELRQSGALKYSVRQTAAPRERHEVHINDAQYHHSYAIWSLYPYGSGGPYDEEEKAWRVEEFLGLDRARGEAHKWQEVANDTPEADIVVLDDAGMGFRDRQELWPVALTASGQENPWILLKMASPLAQGPLWEHLHRYHPKRLIVVATVNDLRLSEVQISRELSWERTAQDIFWELVHNPCVNALSDCAHIIVSFGTSGAILLSRKGEESRPTFQCTLFFDPQGIEGMWEQSYPGGMIGYTTCLTAGIARQLLLAPETPNLNAGIQAGLAAMRTLHQEGYGVRGTPASHANLVFPMELIKKTLAQPMIRFTDTAVQDPARFIQKEGEPAEKPLIEGYWTILEERYKNTLGEIAERVVLEGPEIALRDVPWGKFGKLLTVDRQEIESFHSIRNLIFEYCRQGPQKRPLSIAVFGPPGSGKSFGIKQIAKSLLPDQIHVCEFNLSQFDSEKDLHAAFHQVRDAGLKGTIPLVFWDEFDTSLEEVPLGWLRYFLAPMQDGTFQEGQINHPIGRSIFVFAGGTSKTMAAFDQGTEKEFKKVKGPDFVSRLKGYINVLGPNPVGRSGTNATADPYFIIRRAILLRSSLEDNAPQLFGKRDGRNLLNIDPGVLRALLNVKKYRHGARSIESIISMSRLKDKTSFERSSLPSESQLTLHVDGGHFLSLVRQVELEGKALEALAAAIHACIREKRKKHGYPYDPQTDLTFQASIALEPYDELPEHMKEQNRHNVLDIPIKLAKAGYIMVPAHSNNQKFSFPDETLEELAEAEHERWVLFMKDAGWSFAHETDRAQKKHNCILPWDNLSDEEKEKDRDIVRCIADVLAHAGYVVVKSGT